MINLKKEHISLTSEQQANFQLAIKIGILKQLHKDKMLTDSQLSYMLSDLHAQKTSPPYQNTCASLKDV